MFDPTRDKLDRDFEESMRMFEKALVPARDPIEPKQPAKILVAMDGSSQDPAVIEAATNLQSRFESKILILDGRELTDQRVSDEAIAQVSGIAGAELLPKISGPGYDQILTASERYQPDLIVLPCPFGRDFEKIGAESVGTVIDVMLARCAVPMLIIRRIDQPLVAACRRVSMIVSAECDAETLAASWALGLTSEAGSISLNVVVDKEQLENLKSILEMIVPERELQPDDLNNALAESHTALHAAMQKSAFDAGLSYELIPKASEIAPPLLGDEATPQLIVLASEVDDRFVQGFIIDRIRRSPHPVLVAATHVSTSTA